MFETQYKQVGLPEQKARITQDGLRGRFTHTKAEAAKLEEKNFKQQIEKNVEFGIIKRGKGLLDVNLQLFAEKDIKNQNSSSLRHAIRKYEKRIEEHKEKISNPERYIPGWNLMESRSKEGLKRHWNKEIKNFRQSIQDRVDELKKRGDLDE